MKKLLLVLAFCAVAVFAGEETGNGYGNVEYVGDGVALASSNSESTVDESETYNREKVVSETRTAIPQGTVRFYLEGGFIGLGLGARVHLGYTGRNYMQASLAYDMGYIRVPVDFFVGGKNLHGIVGFAFNIVHSYGDPQMVSWALGVNYDINEHIGFNVKLTSMFFWPSETPSTIVVNAQYAF